MTGSALTPDPTSAALARGVSATSWYIAISILLFFAATLVLWAVSALITDPPPSPAAAVFFAAGAVLSFGAAVVLLTRYRREGDDEGSGPRRWHSWWPLGAAAVGALLLGATSGSVLFGVAMMAASICLLRWPRGIRWRLALTAELALVAIWAVESPELQVEADAAVALLFTIMLPAVTALSLWSWDVVLELDRARGVEARLAAVQERLRLAGELHDLQGHHLQVIALQLELAERMLPRDPAAAVEQVRLARASVDEARAGTRELASRFRGVPLPDELANAADLLRAAGLRVELDIAADAEEAPAQLLGPVVRECTTNVLKHGGGTWAQWSLRRAADGWVLRVANDPGAGSTLGSGSGLESIAHRVGVVGGDLRSRIEPGVFEVTVRVPAGAATAGEGER